MARRMGCTGFFYKKGINIAMKDLDAVEGHSRESDGKQDKIRLEYLPVVEAYSLIYKNNMKLHDIGAICASIAHHGFKGAVHYDETLGAIDDGNGRVEALYMMMCDGWDVPRGIVVEEETAHRAMAYVFDANNLNLLGGDMNVDDTMRMYEKDALAQLLELGAAGELPVSVDGDDLDVLLKPKPGEPEDGEPEKTEREPLCCPECGYVFES